jgi:hypothetical protein
MIVEQDRVGAIQCQAGLRIRIEVFIVGSGFGSEPRLRAGPDPVILEPRRKKNVLPIAFPPVFQ